MVGAAGPVCRIHAARQSEGKVLTGLMLGLQLGRRALTPAQQLCVAARSFVPRWVLPSFRVIFSAFRAGGRGAADRRRRQTPLPQRPGARARVPGCRRMPRTAGAPTAEG